VKRHSVLNRLDRHFFREQYDARRIFERLLVSSGAASDYRELSSFLTSAIDRALHVESIGFFLHNRKEARLVSIDGRFRDLDISNLLLVETSSEAFDVDFDDPHSPVHRLSQEERDWLVDIGAALLLPLHASDGSLLALLALGEKKSELPFSTEDRDLLRAAASSSAMALENRLLRGTDLSMISSQITGAGESAVECSQCFLITRAPQGTRCAACDGTLLNAPLPPVLDGKFRLEKRVGAGGMGVVYRAIDLTLGRPVALKTLPRVSPVFAVHLRREARVIARISHPNLALIYGAENWRGMPILVFEFLSGGTVAQRLREGGFSVREAIDLGTKLARVLERIHSAGILHLDIKPSNVGYDDNGVPKLLDFGLAQIFSEWPTEKTSLNLSSETGSVTLKFNDHLSLLPAPGGKRLVGTPLYMSPEAIRGKQPAPSFDLWGLALLLYECIAGQHPIERRELKGILRFITDEDIPDIRTIAADCDERVAMFFLKALSRDSKRRHSGAKEFRQHLERLYGSV
jgi:hypothetical protein